MDNSSVPEIKKLEEKVKFAVLPDELKQKALEMINRLTFIVKGGSYSLEYENTAKYIDWITSLPWENYSKDVLDLETAKHILDKNHYGLKEVKSEIMEYLSVLIFKNIKHNQEIVHAPVLCLVGLVGTGKTTIAYSVAEALGRKIVRIPFGGMGAAALLRGQSRVFPSAEPGYIIKALKRCGTLNPVILLDEIDRVAEGSRSDIMGVLVELLDPEQNKNFSDNFIDFSFDLSKTLFITTSNNTKDISNAVLDRLEIIQMPSYSDNEKMTIGKYYMFPKILEESGLSKNDVIIDDTAWADVIRPLGYDPGIRTLQRTIQGIVRKVVYQMLEGKINQGGNFIINKENIHGFLPSL